MIIQELNKYYRFKSEQTDSEIAPYGLKYQPIRWTILLDQNGHFKRFKENFSVSENTKNLLSPAQSFLVPQGHNRTSGVSAFLLWDKFDYIFGIPQGSEVKTQKEIDRAKVSQEAFIARIEKTFENNTESDAYKTLIQPVLIFLNNLKKLEYLALIQKDKLWSRIIEDTGYFSFAISGIGNNHLVADMIQQPDIKDIVLTYLNTPSKDERQAICSISGDLKPVGNNHFPIQGIIGSSAQGAVLVSYNLESSEAYVSKTSKPNQISNEVIFNYTTALNYLLRRDSKQKFTIADTTFVFWSAIDDTDLAESIPKLVHHYNSDPNIDDVKNKLSLFRKRHKDDKTLDQKFCLLGLSAHKARIVVSYWQVDTIQNLLKNLIDRYVDDLTIENQKKQIGLMSLNDIFYRMDIKKPVAPFVKGLIKAIFTGSRYPRNLLNVVLQSIHKIHDGEKVNIFQASLLKAYLNREPNHISFDSKLQIIESQSADLNIDKTSYNLGRLFSVCCRIFYHAHIKNLETLFYKSFSTNPELILPQLISKTIIKLNQLDIAFRISLDKELNDILNQIGFIPTQLNLNQQAIFALGYYFQHSLKYQLDQEHKDDEKPQKLTFILNSQSENVGYQLGRFLEFADSVQYQYRNRNKNSGESKLQSDLMFRYFSALLKQPNITYQTLLERFVKSYLKSILDRNKLTANVLNEKQTDYLKNLFESKFPEHKSKFFSESRHIRLLKTQNLTEAESKQISDLETQRLNILFAKEFSYVHHVVDFPRFTQPLTMLSYSEQAQFVLGFFHQRYYLLNQSKS